MCFGWWAVVFDPVVSQHNGFPNAAGCLSRSVAFTFPPIKLVNLIHQGLQMDHWLSAGNGCCFFVSLSVRFHIEHSKGEYSESSSSSKWRTSSYLVVVDHPNYWKEMEKTGFACFKSSIQRHFIKGLNFFLPSLGRWYTSNFTQVLSKWKRLITLGSFQDCAWMYVGSVNFPWIKGGKKMKIWDNTFGFIKRDEKMKAEPPELCN